MRILARGLRSHKIISQEINVERIVVEIRRNNMIKKIYLENYMLTKNKMQKIKKYSNSKTNYNFVEN